MPFLYFEADSQASTYDKFRPCPPEDLIQTVIDFLKEKKTSLLETAVDVGCGSGQSTAALASHFNNVIGLDPCPVIIEEAKHNNKLNNISYRVSSAEEILLPDNSVDLVITTQAVHWFDLSRFYPEVNRILKQDGVLAIIGYHLPQPKYMDKGDELSKVVKKYYKEVLGDYVFPESKMVYLDNYRDDKYNQVPFINEPMTRKENFLNKFDGSVEDLTGYISTWSGFQNYKKKEGEKKALKILQDFESEINEIMQGTTKMEGDREFKIIFNYFLLFGRKG